MNFVSLGKTQIYTVEIFRNSSRMTQNLYDFVRVDKYIYKKIIFTVYSFCAITTLKSAFSVVSKINQFGPDDGNDDDDDDAGSWMFLVSSLTERR